MLWPHAAGEEHGRRPQSPWSLVYAAMLVGETSSQCLGLGGDTASTSVIASAPSLQSGPLASGPQVHVTPTIAGSGVAVRVEWQWADRSRVVRAVFSLAVTHVPPRSIKGRCAQGETTRIQSQCFYQVSLSRSLAIDLLPLMPPFSETRLPGDDGGRRVPSLYQIKWLRAAAELCSAELCSRIVHDVPRKHCLSSRDS